MNDVIMWVGFWFIIALIVLWLIDRYDKAT